MTTKITKDYITYLPSSKTFTVSPSFSIHTRETFVNKKLVPSLKTVAKASNSCTKTLCNDSNSS